MPRLPRLSGNDRDKHRGRSGGDTLKAKDGENTKTTTGGFHPDGPNLDSTLVKATKADGVVLKDDNKPRTAPDPSTEQ